MGALASFVLRGPGQAALVAAAALTLSVAFPPIVWLSNATIALFVMRFGFGASIPMLVISLVGAIVLSWVVLGHALLGAFSAAVFWLPVMLAAVVLRKTVSLELSTLACVALAIAVVLISYVVLGDPAVFWGELLRANPQLNELLAQSAQQGGVDLIESFAKLATGILATGVLLNTLAGLYLGRYWQALQFQPGGFHEAFVGFKLGKAVLLVVVLVCVLSLFSGTGLGIAIVMPLVFLLAVQGLAVVHGVAAARQWPKVVLVMVYLALLVPHVVVLICVLSLVDAWFDLRARAQRS